MPLLQPLLTGALVTACIVLWCEFLVAEIARWLAPLHSRVRVLAAV